MSVDSPLCSAPGRDIISRLDSGGRFVECVCMCEQVTYVYIPSWATEH